MSLPPALSPRFAEAATWACELHARQRRKGSQIPYICHPFAVAALVLEHGGDEDQAIAALLHDGPEDQGGQPVLDEVRRRFGDRVAALVEALSDSLEEGEKQAWRPRKERYLRHLREAAPADALLISIADKLHNASSTLRDYDAVGELLWERFNGKRDGTLWYYAALLDVYRARPEAPPRILASLSAVLGELLGGMGAMDEAGGPGPNKPA